MIMTTTALKRYKEQPQKIQDESGCCLTPIQQFFNEQYGPSKTGCFGIVSRSCSKCGIHHSTYGTGIGLVNVVN
jgi:hypothetical protein